MTIIAKDSRLGTVTGMSALILTGLSLAWWMVLDADRAMRKARLEKAKSVARSLDLKGIRALTGTASDLNRHGYLRLKRQMADMAGADEACRFIYLLGRRNDGGVFFYADSEPPGSEEESLAGRPTGRCRRSSFPRLNRMQP